MKKLIISSFLLLSGLIISAQENVVKIGLGSAIQFDLQLKYERTFLENHSFQIGVLGDFKESIDNNTISRFGFDIDAPFSFDLSGFAIIPEYRYYFSNAGAPRGFYVGAYGRYRQRNAVFNTSLFETDIDFEATGRLSNFGIGVGIGAQFIINDAFSIDWYIGGIGYNWFGARFAVAPLNDEDFDVFKVDVLNGIDDLNYDDFSEFIDQEEYDLIVESLREGVEQTESIGFRSARFPFGLLDIRTGISLGYAF